MIKLVRNEFIKIKRIKIIFIELLIIIVIGFIYKYSKIDIFDLSFKIIPFLAIVVSILYGGIISKEMENGNFRYYLTKPYKRWKIYLSKLLCIYIYIFITNLLVIILCLIIKNSIDYSYILKYIKYSITTYFMGSLSLYLSTKIKSQSVVVGISIFIFSFSLIILQLLLNIGIKYTEYTFLPYLDFSVFDNIENIKSLNSEYNMHLSVQNGIIIDFIYMLIMYFLGNHKFIKKDIKS